MRPDRGHYASVGEQLSAIEDDIWDHAQYAHSAQVMGCGAAC